jgi:pimeloyl-ACP methyl ester carboxylesterase
MSKTTPSTFRKALVRASASIAATSALLVSGCSSTPSGMDGGRETYVLVHGAFEDASVWKATQQALERSGHKTVAVNLPGRTGNPLPAAQTSLDLYAKTVIDAIGATGDKPVVLVGHSFGGITISNVAEQTPQKVKLLVYLAAYVPKDGQSVIDIATKDPGSKVGPHFRVNEQSLTSSIEASARAELFVNDGAAPLKAGFAATMVDEPVPPQGQKVRLATAFAGVPKAYVQTLRDQVVSPQLQSEMAATAGITQIERLDTGHAPFLTQPEALAGALARVASAARR